MRLRSLVALMAALVLCATGSSPAAAAGLPCNPCAGLEVEDPFAVVAALTAAPRLTPTARFFVAWDATLDGAASPAGAHAVAAAGGAPWLRLRFTTPSPLLANIERLQRELEAAAELARLSPPETTFSVLWPGGGAPDVREYAFLLKRAAVAISGAAPQARVVTQPLAADPAWLTAFYGEEVAAYLDGIALAEGEEAALAAAAQTLDQLDPGRPRILDAVSLPEPSRRALLEAARGANLGITATLFRASFVDAAALAPLKVLANEFAGDLQPDRGTVPTGGGGAWSFVRGEDLGLRVLVSAEPADEELVLTFPDPQLRQPARIDLATGEAVPLGDVRKRPEGVTVRFAGPQSVELLRLERASIAELEGVEEEVTVETERLIPVEEILRRLQATEDAQARRLRHYQALNRTTLRFQAASGVQTVEATFEGELFARRGEPFDWAWQTFYINGVKWRGKSIPELPLIQPEKAAAMPLEVLFTKEYTYSLAGTDEIDGRDCWVVEFEPAVAVAPGRNLFRGKVWIDRALAARVRLRAVQLGLEGEVLSNEETMYYSPVDPAGQPAPWSPEAFVLPLRTTGQQILSVLNTATVVEREVRLTGVVINGPSFDERREQVRASEATMVRDTDEGLRYLVKDEASGERQVKEGYDSNRLFLLAGGFYDDSLDYPLPLVGVNYFDINFRGNNRQLNAFFGGVLGIVNYADPRVFGSKFDLGIDVFAFAIATSDQLYRDGVESPGEEVEERPANVTVNLGYPLGNFAKATASYRLAYSHYGEADDTAPEFVVPESHLTQRFQLELALARSGYRLALEGAYHRRSGWEPWGLPDSDDYDPAAADYLTWEVAASKNWYLRNFQKIGLELNYAGGEDLDRFSKYQFGFFGGNRVHGYQIGKVRAEEAYAAHLTYGFEIGKLLRLDAVYDAAWATDATAGLDRESLTGIGLMGTFIGPWDTIVNLDVGTPLSGPDDGVVAYVVFLKLFD